MIIILFLDEGSRNTFLYTHFVPVRLYQILARVTPALCSCLLCLWFWGTMRSRPSFGCGTKRNESNRWQIFSRDVGSTCPLIITTREDSLVPLLTSLFCISKDGSRRQGRWARRHRRARVWLASVWAGTRPSASNLIVRHGVKTTRRGKGTMRLHEREGGEGAQEKDQ